MRVCCVGHSALLYQGREGSADPHSSLGHSGMPSSLGIMACSQRGQVCLRVMGSLGVGQHPGQSALIAHLFDLLAQPLVYVHASDALGHREVQDVQLASVVVIHNRMMHRGLVWGQVMRCESVYLLGFSARSDLLVPGLVE